MTHIESIYVYKIVLLTSMILATISRYHIILFMECHANMLYILHPFYVLYIYIYKYIYLF